MADATTVFVFQQFDPKPVYHLPTWLVQGRQGWRELEDGGEQSTCLCGLATWTWRPGNGTNTEHAIRLRWDHARVIGRMCKRCEDIYYQPEATA